MKPILLSFGALHLYSYGLCIALGVLLSLFLMKRRAAQEVHWYLQSFGLSPASRGRVKTSDNRQTALFEQPGVDAWKL